jgi:acetyltransferase-like isoleucine patch superfamily enzyme
VVIVLLNKYSFSEILKTFYSLLITKMFFHNARLIRRPIYLRGRKSIFGANKLTTGYNCRFDLNGKQKTLFIGDYCEMGDNAHIVAHKKIFIGNNVLIASNVFISDTNHGNYQGSTPSSPSTKPNERLLNYNPVFIGDNVWIGQNCVILPGSSIPEGCIIGANSVVNTKFETKNCIIVGSPAKIIKVFDFDKKVWIKSNK